MKNISVVNYIYLSMNNINFMIMSQTAKDLFVMEFVLRICRTQNQGMKYSHSLDGKFLWITQ
jgi:hypothetical protein